MPTVRIDETTEIHYRDLGSGAAVLFVHGWMASGRVFDRRLRRSVGDRRSSAAARNHRRLRATRGAGSAASAHRVRAACARGDAPRGSTRGARACCRGTSREVQRARRSAAQSPATTIATADRSVRSHRVQRASGSPVAGTAPCTSSHGAGPACAAGPRACGGEASRDSPPCECAPVRTRRPDTSARRPSRVRRDRRAGPATMRRSAR